MAANPIVLSRASQVFPHVNFDFLTWLTGSIVPCLFCALALPILLQWQCGLHKATSPAAPAVHDEEQHQGGGQASAAALMSGRLRESTKAPSDSIVKHAQCELDRMGSMSAKEWVTSDKTLTRRILTLGLYTKSNCASCCLPASDYGSPRVTPVSMLPWWP